MREALNNNPVVQAVAIGILAVVVAFLLITRVMNQSEPEPAPETSATTAGAAPTGTATPPAEAATTPATGAAPTTEAVPPATATDPAVEAAAAGEFVAGPGLPPEVVKAYADGDVVVLLVVHPKGIEDRKVEAMVESLRSRGDTAVFVVAAPEIADYSRITRGVNVDRTPALVVLSPRSLSEDGTPVASVGYGFRGPKSVDQAVEDALYEGRKDLPYYPE